MKQNQSNLNSIEKALKVLLAFDHQRPAWGVRELGAHLGFSPATIQRILQTLKSSDFVDQDDETRQYRLGSVYYRFLHTLQSTYPLNRAAVPFMAKLSFNTRETVHLNVLDNFERVCVDMIESPKDLKASMPIGSRSPLHAGASSKCLAAFSDRQLIDKLVADNNLSSLTGNTITDVDAFRSELDAVKKRGYAASLGERNPGIGSLSAPVFNHRGLLVASISLAIPELRYKESGHCDFCLEKLLTTAQKLSHVMGYLVSDNNSVKG
jgi:DNA-binding IclR family transcriptional regulator